MVLAIDIGNTHVVAGLFRGEKLVRERRFETRALSCERDVSGILGSFARSDVKGAIVSSVVPRLNRPFEGAIRTICGCGVVNVSHRMDTGLAAALRKTTAVIRGNITDETTGDPIMFCRVFLVDNPNMEENLSFATSDASGYYELDAFEGSDLMFGADQDGYARNFTLINVTSGEDQWRDITLKPFSAWLVGQVTNAMSGAPIADASVHLMGPIELGEWTDGSAMYNMSLVPGDYEVEVNYWMGPVGFKTYRANITILDGVENVLNVALVPWDNALVKGHVYDVISSAAVSDADIWIIGEWWGNWTDVNMTGDFEVYYVDGEPVVLTLTAPSYARLGSPSSATLTIVDDSDGYFNYLPLIQQ